MMHSVKRMAKKTHIATRPEKLDVFSLSSPSAEL